MFWRLSGAFSIQLWAGPANAASAAPIEPPVARTATAGASVRGTCSLWTVAIISSVPLGAGVSRFRVC